MRPCHAWGLILLAIASRLPAAEPPQRLLWETWESAAVDGARVGYLHTTVREVEGDGVPHLRAAAELDLSFRRYNAPMRVRMEQGTNETSDGRVLGVFMRQWQDGGRQLELIGKVEGDRLIVVVDKGRLERRLRWSEDVLGLAGQDRLLAERRPKPGDRFSFLRYEPTFNTVVTVHVVARGIEEVPGDRRKLLRVEWKPDRIETATVKVQPPGVVVWLDETFATVRRDMDLEGIGTVTLTRTTRENATNSPLPGKGTDIGLKAMVALNRRIPRPHATQAVEYRLTIQGDDDPGTAMAQDDHQEIRNVRRNGFDLLVHPIRPNPGAAAGPAATEYTASSYYLDWEDARITALSQKAVGDAKDAWEKAQCIERWVHRSLRPDNVADFVPASQVARELRGDCRAYALLTTALCRAEGIPARTAVGLLYVERGPATPQMGFHVWTEVCLGGRWIGLDGTLGLGGIGACHLKIADHSWHATRSLTPFLPVSRIVGRTAIEVVRVESRD